ncbi:zinc finger protein 541 isoform X1, partial [Acipenser oxyrinchus oxyrinchus]
AGGAVPSQLRSPVYLASHLLNPGGQPPVSYTPPPMLSPLRPGTGLYFSTLQQAPPSVPATGTYTAKLGKRNEQKWYSIFPPRCINIGPRFQAVIPPLQEEALAWSEEHRASLVWEPWGDLAENRDTQSRVEKLLSVGCSSALPGGGTNTELALHCLHEAEGDVLAALKTLLFTGPQRAPEHPLRDYHYAGSDHWTPEERNLFQKALSEHGKDFHCIQRELQCKTVAQCVEYYYTMKKHKKFLQPGRDSEEQDSGQEPVSPLR